MKKILALDFDGVLHSYKSGWKGPRTISDPPTDGAILFLRSAVVEFDVCIFSTRTRYFLGRFFMKRWLRKHALAVLSPPVAKQVLDAIRFPKDKPPAHVTVDDRALTFDGTFPSIESLRDFQPWNKKKIA